MRAVPNLKKVPTEVLKAEIERRLVLLRQKHGPNAAKKKFYVCVGCKGEYSASDMRTHECVISCWFKRFGLVWDNAQRRYVKPEENKRGKRAA